MKPLILFLKFSFVVTSLNSIEARGDDGCDKNDQSEDFRVLRELKEARDQSSSATSRSLVVEKSLSYLQDRVLGKLGLERDKKKRSRSLLEIRKMFNEKPELLKKLGFLDHCPLSQINSELSLLADQMRIESIINKCTAGDVNLKNLVKNGSAEYEVCPGGFEFESIRLGQSQSKVSIPRNLVSASLSDLLVDFNGIESEVQKQEIMTENSPILGKWNDYLSSQKNKQKSNIADEIVALTYERAKALRNSYVNAFNLPILNRVTFKLRSGLLKNEQIDEEVKQGIADCKYCSEEDKKTIYKRVKTQIQQQVDQGLLKTSSPDQILDNLCRKLRDSDYFSISSGQLKNGAITEFNFSARQTSFHDEVESFQMARLQRRSILQSILLHGGDNLFLLTKAIGGAVDENSLVKIKCHPDSKMQDKKILLEAIDEIQKNTKDFSDKLNSAVKKVAEGDRSNDTILSSLKDFLTLSPESLGSALHGLQLNRDWICDVLMAKTHDDAIKNLIDFGVLMWGTGIAGAGIRSAGQGLLMSGVPSITTAYLRWENESVVFQAALDNLQFKGIDKNSQRLRFTEKQRSRLKAAEQSLYLSLGAIAAESILARLAKSGLKSTDEFIDAVEAEVPATGKGKLVVDEADIIIKRPETPTLQVRNSRELNPNNLTIEQLREEQKELITEWNGQTFTVKGKNLKSGLYTGIITKEGKNILAPRMVAGEKSYLHSELVIPEVDNVATAYEVFITKDGTVRHIINQSSTYLPPFDGLKKWMTWWVNSQQVKNSKTYQIMNEAPLTFKQFPGSN